jgi:hypothetical protein
MVNGQHRSTVRNGRNRRRPASRLSAADAEDCTDQRAVTQPARAFVRERLGVSSADALGRSGHVGRAAAALTPPIASRRRRLMLVALYRFPLRWLSQRLLTYEEL